MTTITNKQVMFGNFSLRVVKSLINFSINCDKQMVKNVYKLS